MFSAFQTFGRLGAGARAVAAAWSPLALWPNGAASPGMWIDPSLLTASFNDYAGTTPVATPGSVADSANPVGLALDIRAGAPGTLGPELVTNGDFSDGTTGWSWSNIVDGKAVFDGANSDLSQYIGPLKIGAFYQVSWYQSGASVYVRLGGSGNLGSQSGAGQKTMILSSPGTAGLVLAQGGMTPNVDYIDNISVKEIPGNHMFQATSTARPLESARVNLLTSTENFTDGTNWGAGATTLGSDITAGGMTLTRVVETATIANHDIYGRIALTAGVPYTLSAKFKAGERSVATIRAWAIDYGSDDSAVSYFDLVAGTAQKAVSPNVTDAGITAISDGVYLCWVTCKPALTSPSGSPTFGMSIAVGTFSYLGYPSSGIYIGEASTTIGALTDYQYIASDSTYPSTGITPFQLYDGVDDGMATASFAAGALINGMDCMIPVRRDSAAACVAGLYNSIADATKFFGMAESGSGSGCVGSGAGTPTVWVDGVQLTGGTAVTRGTLHTALTAGSYHILEFRGLDLSTWTAAGFGLYTSYLFHGPRGDIMLYPSTSSTADKDAARQYLADYYGVTLP